MLATRNKMRELRFNFSNMPTYGVLLAIILRG